MSVNLTAAHIAGVSCHSEEQSDVKISRKGIRVISQGVRSRRLPRYARNDRVLRTEWNNGQCLAMTLSALHGIA